MNAIKLVYNAYENDVGFVHSDEQGDHTHVKIPGIDESKVFTFYTWGKHKHDPIECDLVFDASLFSTKISVDVKCLTGLDDIVQQSILNHPNFDYIMENTDQSDGLNSSKNYIILNQLVFIKSN